MKTKNRISKRSHTSITNYWFLNLLIISLFLYVMPSMAQDQPEKEKKWKFVVAPYVMFPYMSGDVAIGQIPIDVNVNPGDIVSNLDFGAMLYFEASNDKWAIIFDGLYMKLGQEGTTPMLSRKVELDVDQLALTVSGMYRLASWVEVGVGGRFNSIGYSLKIAPGEIVLPGQDLSNDQTWFDPLIVARFMTRFNDSKWRLSVFGDIGGFGIGSDFAWQVNPYAGYQFSKLFELGVAYRWLGMNYDTGSGSDYFLYDLVISGPEIGFLFHF